MSPNRPSNIDPPAPDTGNPALTFTLWFAAGVAAGAAAGLLLAPSPGRDTRDAINARAGYTSESAKLYIDRARDMARSFVETAQVQATRLSEAMAAGVEEARRIRDELAEMNPQSAETQNGEEGT